MFETINNADKEQANWRRRLILLAVTVALLAVALSWDIPAPTSVITLFLVPLVVTFFSPVSNYCREARERAR
jgi:hypothetical protein